MNTSEEALNHDRDKLQQCTQDIIDILYEASITVEDFDPEESQQVLFSKINDHLITKYNELDKLRTGYSPQIPFKVLEYIDEAKNPSLYIKDMLEFGIIKNAEAKMKIETMEMFEKALKEQIQSKDPSLVQIDEEGQELEQQE